MAIGAYGDVLGVPTIRNIQLLGLLARIAQFGAGIVLTVHVVEHLADTYAAAGLVVACYTVASGLGGPWRGRLLDRYGLRRSLLPSLVVVPIVWCIAPFVGYWPLLPLVAIAGAFNVPISSVIRVVLIANAPEGRQRTALSLDSVIVEICFMVGPLLAIFAATTWGTRATLVALWLTSTVGAGLLAWLNPPVTRESDAEESATGWVSIPVVGVLAAVATAGFILGGTEVALIATFRELGQAAAIGAAVAIWSFGSAVGGLAYGAWHRRIPVPALLAALAVTALPLAWISSIWTSVPLLLLAGIACAPLVAATVDALGNLVPQRFRGEAIAWHASALTAGTSLGPPLVGAIMDARGPAAGFVATSVLGLAIAVVVAVTVRRARAAASTAPSAP
jgi:MFS family permease